MNEPGKQEKHRPGKDREENWGGPKARERTDWPAVAFGIVLASLVAFQQFKLPPVLPVLLAAYHWDRTLAGGMMAIYALVGLLFSIPIGHALQRRGTFHPLLAALAILLVGNLLAFAAPQNAWLVLAARGLEGVGYALGGIAGPALANRSAAERDLGFVIGLTAGWIPAGQLAATGLALVLPDWQALWIVGALVTCAMMLWSVALRHHSVLAAPSVGTPQRIKPTTQQRHELYLTGGIFLLWSMQYFAYVTWLPQYLVEVVGLSATATAASYALPPIMIIVFNLVTGALLGRGVSLAAMLTCGLLSQAAIWWLIPFTHGTAEGLVSLIVYGIGAGVTPACLFALPATILGRAGAPTAFGYMMSGRNTGVFLGPILLAEVTKTLGGWSAAWPVFGSTSLVAVAAAVGLGAVLRRR
jgi:predicted MFS family arabinose efflux permease